ncbi:FRG domain-containing protein [Thalassobaculum sp.]|uniref:FRG domain-containing protein n=1 Tax=Thalassobaculum sp. TaxID=2022740 RepID=UPI0032ED37A0
MPYVESVEQFVSLVENTGPQIFRGQTRDWAVLPGILRPTLADARQRNPELEKNLLQRFRLNAAAYIPVLERTEKPDWWRCAAIAQHHGLPTRLLDWTRNALTALYFAVAGKHAAANPAGPDAAAQDSVVFCRPLPEVFTFGKFSRCFPWMHADRQVMFLQPDVTHSRIFSQSSLFSVHPGSPVDKVGAEAYAADLQAIRIRASDCDRIQIGLARLGVHRVSLFPDADSVASHVVWEVDRRIDRLSDRVMLGISDQESLGSR